MHLGKGESRSRGVLRKPLSALPQDGAPGLCRSQRLPGAISDQVALRLGYHCKQLQGQLTSPWIVGHPHVHVGIKQLSQEGKATAKPIQPRDDEDGLLTPAQCQSPLQSWPFVHRTALHLHHAVEELPAILCEVPRDQSRLRLKAEPGPPLPLCRDPHVRYKFGH